MFHGSFPPLPSVRDRGLKVGANKLVRDVLTMAYWGRARNADRVLARPFSSPHSRWEGGGRRM